MRTSPFFSFVVLLLPPLLAALPGCSESGALGQASVTQGCAGSNLPCQSTADFDTPLAVGASVPVSIDLMLMGGGQPPLQLVSTDGSVFTVAEETLTGVGAGLATLLITSADSVVIDFVAVWVQQPSGIAVSRLSDEGEDVGEIQGSLGVLVGDTVDVAVSALSSTEPLAGTAPTTWSVADPTVASVLDEGIVGRGSVIGRAAGTTTVTASALGFEQTFTVEVTP
jgi:hypothetical protein